MRWEIRGMVSWIFTVMLRFRYKERPEQDPPCEIKTPPCGGSGARFGVETSAGFPLSRPDVQAWAQRSRPFLVNHHQRTLQSMTRHFSSWALGVKQGEDVQENFSG